MRSFALILIMIMLAPALSHSAQIIGEARVVDGVTVDIAHVRIRLYGLEAPETDQLCAQADCVKNVIFLC